MGHALMENRSGLVVQAHLGEANGTAEREAALIMIDRQKGGTKKRVTLAGDKGYDTAGFGRGLRRIAKVAWRFDDREMTGIVAMGSTKLPAGLAEGP